MEDVILGLQGTMARKEQRELQGHRSEVENCRGKDRIDK